MGQTNQSELTIDWRSYLCCREERSANALEFSKNVLSWKIQKEQEKKRPALRIGPNMRGEYEGLRIEENKTYSL